MAATGVHAATHADGKAPLLIAGAGIAGLTTAIGLQRAGFRVSVLEQAAQLGEIGAGVSLAPNATRALASLGLLDEVRRVGQAPDRAAVKHYQTGVELTAYELGPQLEARWGAPYIQIARADLHALLVDAVRAADPEAIRLDTRVLEVANRDDGVSVTTSKGVFESPCLLAADGVRSVVRSQLFNQPAPHFLGYVAWRALVPAALLKVAPLEPDTAVCLGPRKSMLRYKLRNSTVVNVVAFAQTDTWSEEGWSVPADPTDIRAAFGDWNEEFSELATGMCASGAFKWGLFGRDPLASWRCGRVLLVGDAAHPMLPFLGQGAAMGIEDGVVLSRAFALSADIDAALSNYERARFERAMTTMTRANEQGLRLHGHFASSPSNSNAVPRDDFAEYGFDAAAVTFPDRRAS